MSAPDVPFNNYGSIHNFGSINNFDKINNSAPMDESRRLDALVKLNILDTPAEERFDRVTRIARRTLGVPIALVTLVDKDRQWFKSSQGLIFNETPRAFSFCSHAIESDAPFIVPDATKDTRFANNPLVTGEPQLRFYAGVPIKAPHGERIGTFCIFDREPRELEENELLTLRDLAAFIQNEFNIQGFNLREKELLRERNRFRHRALVDPLTRIWSRLAIMEMLPKEISRAERDKTPFSVAIADLDHFKSVNDAFGHLAGDAVLREAAQRIRQGLRIYDSVGRFGGEEFLILLPSCDISDAARIAERMRARVADEKIEIGDVTISISASFGLASNTGIRNGTDIIAAADAALQIAKRNGRNRIEPQPA